MDDLTSITQLPVDISELPVDLRLYLLGLPVAPRSRGRGRPKTLTFRDKLLIAITWADTINAHAVAVRDRNRDRAIAKLQAKFCRLCAEQPHPRKLFEVRTAIDKVGRVTQVPIKPPEVDKLTIDAAVAKLFGISARTVRRIRDNPRLRPFMAPPVWLERDWEKAARVDFEVRQVAKRLMTPERYAKNEPLRIFNGGLQVLEGPASELEPNDPLYRPASTLQLDAHAGQPDWFAMQAWLVEMEGVSEPIHEVVESDESVVILLSA